ncbi:MAG: carboxypeptidase-like regulatory domain-containing protein [Candidatus Sulfotelmatobacter sp.]
MKACSALRSTSLTVSLLATLAAAQLPGLITGTVQDEEGSPVVQAQVRVDPLDGRPTVRAVRMVETGKDGHFIMNNLEPMGYKVFAMKESAGYPDTSGAFYSNNVFPTVTLTASVPAVDITLKVGPPAGVMSGSVTDALTGAPVPASFLLRRTLDPGKWISMSQKSDYRVLVPPSVKVSVEVSAPGYKTWFYGGPSDTLNRPPIRLDSGKGMRLDIQLQPEVKLDKQP